MPKRKTQSFQPRKRSGKQLPLLKPPSASSITDPPEVQMNLAFELSQPIPGPSYTLGVQATSPLEQLPSHQLQDLAERISVILKDRWGPQSHEEGKSGSELLNARVASYDKELGHMYTTISTLTLLMGNMLTWYL